MRKTARITAAWLLLCAAGEFFDWLSPPAYESTVSQPREIVVQLRRATLPTPLTPVAVHCWFVCYDPAAERWNRWEVWQDPDSGGISWAHVHKNKLLPDAGVGGGHAMVVQEWRGEPAQRLVRALEASSEYPDRDRYHAWPGPNSNTYVAWICRQAAATVDMDSRAVGKDYLGAVGVGISTTRTGLQIESPVLGFKIGLLDGVEFHLLSTTLGIDTWPPAVKTPFGRLGFRER